jgi:hypothetical protein
MMRNLVLLLLLANLLVLAWQRWIVPPQAADALRLQAQRAPELLLLSLGSGSGADPSLQACLRVGPFGSAEGAEQGARSMAGRGIAAIVEVEPVEVWLGYWVQVPGLADRGAASRASEALAAAGLRDAYVVRTDDGFKVSLGVFKERGRAERVALVARGAGYPVQTTDRTRDGEEYWLRLPPGTGSGVELAELEPEADRILRSESVPCVVGPADGGAARDSLESTAAAAPAPE